MASLLTTNSVLMCPHGGTVTATTTNTRAQVGGGFLVRASDTFVIAGCPFTIPSGVVHPCVTVQWVVPATRSQAGGDFTLTEESVGLCLGPDGAPQGTVLISSTQPQVSGQ